MMSDTHYIKVKDVKYKVWIDFEPSPITRIYSWTVWWSTEDFPGQKSRFVFEETGDIDFHSLDLIEDFMPQELVTKLQDICNKYFNMRSFI